VINGNTPAGQDLTYINNVVLVAGRTTISNGAGESLVDVFNDVDLTGGLTINGGQSDDIVWLRNARLSGNLRVNLGAGRNSAFIFKFYLSGSAFLTTGPGDDGIAMNEVTVGGGVTAGLGNGINLFSIDPYPEGFASTTGSRIAGQLSVTTGSGRDSVRIGGYAPVWVGGPVAIRTGNEVNSLGDAVNLNDVTCADAVLIELGDGSDLLEVDTNTTPVMAACNFGGAFTLRGGGGTETVYLGSNSEAARKVNFARAPILNSGGASDDYLSRRNYSIGGVDAAPFTPINFEIIQP
jgi:hypothetical protein